LREAGEAFEISLLRAVDVEMVGVGGGDDSDVGRQMMERTVVFVGLDDRVGRRGVEQEIAVVVAEHAAEEGVAAGLGGVQYMGGH
jgi:hypothetical protein